MRCIILIFVLYGALGLQIEDDAVQDFVNGNYRFTSAVYKILKETPGNLIVSPTSAEIILALTNEGAKGNTSTELITALSLPSTKEKIRKALQSLIPNLKKSEEDLKLLSANKIYIADNLELEENFRSIATAVYSAGVENIDFSKGTESSAKINNWVEDNTNHKIKDIIKPNGISSSTALVLINTLYFSGRWVSEFRVTVRRKYFKTKSDVAEVDTMYQKGSFNYYENLTLNTKFLELPFIGDNISMIIVLPNEIEGLSRLEQDIEQLLTYQPFTETVTEVELPKFAIETEIKFIPILTKLGVKKLFSDADLSGISSTNKTLVVTEVIQKAFINVTESGAEAGAATEATIEDKTRPPPSTAVFKANHPFFYYIRSNGVVLFCGRHVEPEDVEE